MASDRQILAYSLPPISTYSYTTRKLVRHSSTKNMFDTLFPLPEGDAVSLQAAHGIALDIVYNNPDTQAALYTIMTAGVDPTPLTYDSLSDVTQAQRESVISLLKNGPRVVASDLIDDTQHVPASDPALPIHIRLEHVRSLTCSVYKNGTSSIEACRHRLFVAVLILHELGHWIRNAASTQEMWRQAPPALSPKGLEFRNMSTPWLVDSNYTVGEAGFWLEEVAMNGVMGIIEDLTYDGGPERNLYAIDRLVVKQVDASVSPLQDPPMPTAFYISDEVVAALCQPRSANSIAVFTDAIPLPHAGKVPYHLNNLVSVRYHEE